MVVLDTSPPLPAVGLYDLEKSHSGKMMNKRFINLHSWLGPVCLKQVKENMVRSVNFTPGAAGRGRVRRSATTPGASKSWAIAVATPESGPGNAGGPTAQLAL
ncbi:UNVERIFIED_CONTAM: hypothetical protein PYX00_002163 [Menopon gallinae]|uniref:Uncharacterized protein n=1 Tax=Menopon gallinae TaxID=328185 RepID=A0AAW2IGY4_9NEOP